MFSFVEYLVVLPLDENYRLRVKIRANSEMTSRIDVSPFRLRLFWYRIYSLYLIAQKLKLR